MSLRFGDILNLFDYVSPVKGPQTGSLLVTNRPRRNTWLFLFNKLHVFIETLRPGQE